MLEGYQAGKKEIKYLHLAKDRLILMIQGLHGFEVSSLPEKIKKTYYHLQKVLFCDEYLGNQCKSSV